MASASTSYVIGNNYSQYDVFINHRGPDVKKSFASHLYQLLTVHGLRAFLDTEELQEGENITPQIEGAIRTASVHIAIFSPRYAESSWCLNELLLMLESGSTILPVFYNVDPSELRWTLGANGLYAQALCNLKEKKSIDSQTRRKNRRYDSDTIAKWRKALSDVAEISGFELKACNGDEGQLVHKVLEQVLKKIGKTPLNVAKYPTGLDGKVKDVEMTLFLQQQSEEVKVVGIVGLGGVGKTTLAKEFFNCHRSKYDRSCFVSDVRENAAKGSLNSLQGILLKDLAEANVQINNTHEGIENLKRHLSSSRQYLVVVDDVDHIDQLDALFSPVKDIIHSDSLFLITSRDKNVLTNSGIVEPFIYEVKGLNRDHSLELFCSHAFHRPYPDNGFEQLVEKFLDACHGLPLALKVIGALLRGKDLEYWEAQLHKISKILPSDIRNRLQSSYDSLDQEEKEIFLDIACFFIGQDRDTAIRIWDGSHWEGWLGFRNLENKCLVEVDSRNCIRMHDHLRDLGRDLAEKEHPGCHLRLWRPTDNLVHKLSARSPVRGISTVHGNDPEQSFENLVELADSSLSINMSRLQLLRAKGNCVESIFSVAQSPQLVWLCWYACPFPSLPSWISLKNLRVLYITGRELATLWEPQCQAPLQLRELNISADLLEVPTSIGKLKHLEKFVLSSNFILMLPDSVGNLRNLQSLDLGRCYNLQMLPDSVGRLANLQHLDLCSCYNLQMLPDSVGKLTKLQRLDLRECSKLLMLPDSLGNLTNLQSLDLRECSKLHMLPDSVGKLTNLQRLDLRECSKLDMLPDSVGNLRNLRRLDLRECSKLQMLPDSAGNLTNLQSLDLSGCYNLKVLPDSVGKLTSLQSIGLGWCFTLQMLPDSSGNMTKLQRIYLEGCSNLEMLPDSIGKLVNLQSIDLGGCSNLQMLPDSLGKLTNLQGLDLSECSNLRMLPNSVGKLTNLQCLDLGGCFKLQMLPDSAGNLTNLQSLDLSECSKLQILPDSAGNLTNLQSLDLGRCSTLEILPYSLGKLTKLQSLDLRGCNNLQMLPGSVGKLTNLQNLDLGGCFKLQMLPNSVGKLRKLQIIDLGWCSTLQMLPDSVGNLTNLKHIYLDRCSNLEMLPHSVGKWTNLQSIDLSGCSNLHMLPNSLGKLTKLQSLDLSECSKLQMLPDSAGNLTNLQSVDLGGCFKLQMLPDSIGNLMNRRRIDLGGCSNLQTLSDSVGNLRDLQSIDLTRCSNLLMLPDSVVKLTNAQRSDLRGYSAIERNAFAMCWKRKRIFKVLET